MLILLCLTILSCSVENEEIVVSGQNLGSINDNSRRVDSEPAICVSVDLIAGQNEVAGEVTLAKEGESITITYTTLGDWTMSATHLYVGDCGNRPANKPGNPMIGQFPYAETHEAGTVNYTYTIATIELPTFVCIAAHAVVEGPGGSETAWADGLPYGGSSWAMYFQHDLDSCIP